MEEVHVWGATGGGRQGNKQASRSGVRRPPCTLHGVSQPPTIG